MIRCIKIGDSHFSTRSRKLRKAFSIISAVGTCSAVGLQQSSSGVPFLRLIIFGCIVHCIVFLFVITFSNPWRAERFDKPSKTCAPNEPSNGSDSHQQRRENQALDNSAGGPHGVFFAIGFAVESIYFDVCFLWGKAALKPSFRVQRLVGRFIFFLHDWFGIKIIRLGDRPGWKIL